MVKRNYIKCISLLVVISLMGMFLIGCSQNMPGNVSGDKTAADTQSDKPKDQPKEQTGEQPDAQPQGVYPLKSGVTLKYWVELHANATSYARNFAELPFAQELMKRTGINIEYIHPVSGQAQESFNIMVASGDLPDIIEYAWQNYPGGAVSAVADSVIIDLTDILDKYSPNLKAYLKANPDIDKQVKTDDGKYNLYPFIIGAKELLATQGPIVRKDWLDQLNLPVPETVDDWSAMLKAFKEKLNVAAPLTAEVRTDGSQILNIFEGAFGVSTSSLCYQEGGKVKFGLIEPQYKDMLTLFASWYEEGLLDKNFSTADRKTKDANMLNGKSGATMASGGKGLGVYLDTMKDKDPKYDLISVQFPSMKKGETVRHGAANLEFADDGHAAITTNCKNVEAAARLLDYAYGEEGHMLYNYGVEGESYVMENGNPKYTDLIMKNPDGLSLAQAMTKYVRANTNGPFVQDKLYLEQYYQLPQQRAAMKIWSNHDKYSTMMPMISTTKDESDELSKIMADIKTYVSEMQLKFIMGQEPLSNFDQYVAQVKKMNIDRAVEIYQQALDRYLQR